MSRSPVAVLSVLVAVSMLCACAPVGAVGASAPSTAGVDADAKLAATLSTEPNVTYTYRLSLTDTPGVVAVAVDIDIPAAFDESTAFRVAGPSGWTNVSIEGFTRQDWYWSWNGTDRHVTATYRVDVNRDYSLAQGTDEWAYVPGGVVEFADDVAGNPPNRAVHRFDADVTSIRGGAAFLGEYRNTTRTVRGRTVTYVRPTAATGAPTPTAFFSVLEAVEEELEPVEMNGDRLVAFAYPGDPTSTGRAGAASVDNAYFWFRHDAGENVVVHEYVHTRQNFLVAAEHRWVVEGMATFYETKLCWKRDATCPYSLEELDEVNATGRLAGSNDLLTTYGEGAKMMAAIDQRLRRQDDATLEQFLAHLNENYHPGTTEPNPPYSNEVQTRVDEEELAASMYALAGTRSDDWLDEHVNDDVSPNLSDDFWTVYERGERGTLAAYAGTDGYVQTSDLRNIIRAWVVGQIDTTLLRDAITAWVRQTRV